METWDDFKSANTSSKKKFGLCDNEELGKGSDPAYLCENEENIESDWIAQVINDTENKIYFAPIDKCHLIPKINDTDDSKQCDLILNYSNTIAFVELKNRGDKESRKWINLAEKQLKISINHFEQFDFIKKIPVKKAYISNKKRPYTHSSQSIRSERFMEEVGYVLRIDAKIIINEG